MLKIEFDAVSRLLMVVLVGVIFYACTPLLGAEKTPLVFKRVSIEDRQMIGGEAVSFLAPKDWKVAGGVVWRKHPALPAASHVRVYDPNGLTQIEVFPSAPFTWGDNCGPDGLMPTGASWFGNEVLPPLQSAGECLTEVLLPRLRKDIGFKVMRVEAMPELSKACLRHAPPADPGVELTYDAARVSIVYSQDHNAIEEEFVCVMATMRLPVGNISIQVADPVFAMRAASGDLDNQRDVLMAILSSAKINDKWFNKYDQLVEAIVRAKMQEIRDIGEFSRMLSRTSNQMTQARRDKLEAAQSQKDRIDREWNEHNRGIETYDNPYEGQSVELPSGYGHAWVSRSGEYILTDNPNFNPNVERQGDWQPMQQTP